MLWTAPSEMDYPTRRRKEISNGYATRGSTVTCVLSGPLRREQDERLHGTRTDKLVGPGDNARFVGNGSRSLMPFVCVLWHSAEYLSHVASR